VRVSYLTGEQADCLLRDIDTGWLGPASEDFDGYLTERQSVALRWGVLTSIFWYVAGEHYIGTLVLRHGLTPNCSSRVGTLATTWLPPGDAKGMRRGCLRPESNKLDVSGWVACC